MNILTLELLKKIKIELKMTYNIMLIPIINMKKVEMLVVC